MTVRILFPDAAVEGELDLEQAVFGPGFTLEAYRAREARQLPPELWRNCDAIVCTDMALDSDLIGSLDRCRQIVRAGVGYDQIDLAAAAARGIPVCNTPDYGTLEVADHAIAMMLALLRGVVAYSNALKRDPVAGWDFLLAPAVRRLTGLTFGVVGLGRIGTAAALRARAFGMEVVFYDPYRPSGSELAFGFGRAESLAELLSQSDVVSLHVPLTPETRSMIGEEALAAMRPDAVLVNTGRGPLVDIPALLAALRAGRLAGAALDVLPTEPPSGDDPLLAAWRSGDPALADRLLVSPHAAFYSPASMVDLREKSAKVARDYLVKGVLRNCVNGIQAPPRHRLTKEAS